MSADRALSDIGDAMNINDRKINMVRIKEMRCMKPVHQDGV